MLHLRAFRVLGRWLLLVQVGVGGWALAQQGPDTPEQILRRAVEQQQAGDLEGAIRDYEAFLSRYPGAAEVRFTLGNAYGQTGKLQKAIAHYQQALQSGDLIDPTAARLTLGWTYFQAAEFEKARDLVAGVVKERPENREALQLLASSYLRLGEWKKTIELLSPLESELVESPELSYVLGAALVENGQVSKGVSLVEAGLLQSDSAEVRLTLGQALIENGDYFGALKHLERAIALDPGTPSLNATYGHLLRTMTRHDEANDAFLRELEINPDDYDSNRFHGIFLYENEQKYEEALACFERALRARPGDVAVRFQIGLVYNYTNRIEEALQVVKGVVEEHPDFLDGQVALIGLYYRLGREEDAERHRAEAERLRANQDGQHLILQRQFSQAVELFERQKKANPSDPEPYFFKGMALSQAQDWPGAVAEFKEAVRLDPDNPSHAVSYANALARTGEPKLALASLGSLGKAPWKQLDPRLGWLLADTYYQTEEHDRALAVLDFLAGQDPQNANVDLMRSQIRLGKGDFEGARESAEASIQSQPDNNAPAHSVLGTARYQLGDKPAAKAAFLKAVDQDPTNPHHLRKLGALCLQMGDYEQAIKYLERARPAAADSPDIPRLLGNAYQARADGAEKGAPRAQPATATPSQADPGNSAAAELVGRGEWALAAGKVRDAVGLFELAVEKDPENWRARSVLADILLSRGLLEQAYEHLARMDAIDPRSPIGNHLMAQYWYQRRDYGRALDYGLRAKEADPSNADLQNLLGNLYFSRGQTQLAVQEYQGAVALDPERPEFKMNLEVARKRLP